VTISINYLKKTKQRYQSGCLITKLAHCKQKIFEDD